MQRGRSTLTKTERLYESGNCVSDFVKELMLEPDGRSGVFKDLKFAVINKSENRKIGVAVKSAAQRSGITHIITT